jgi:hypothetical protein
MKLKILDGLYSVTQYLTGSNTAPLVKKYSLFLSVTVTDDEISVVSLEEEVVPGYQNVDQGWKAFKFDEILDLSMTGIVSNISSLLAREGISLFTISTFQTDYVFVKEYHLEKAAQVLRRNGYEIVQTDL